MKKKLVLVVAVLIIAVTACALLAGCAPKNPGEFLEKWLDASNKSMVMGNTEVVVNKDIAYMVSKYNDTERYYYYEITKDKLNMYQGYKEGEITEWSKFSKSIEDVKKELKIEGDVTINDILKSEMDLSVNADSFKDFDKNFTKKDGVYVGNKDTDYEGYTLKLTAKEMTMTIGEGEEKIEVSYKIGASKITIPKEALEAEED